MTMTADDRSDSATIKEVAQLAGVATSSVSRVLNDHPDVSSGMRKRVLTAALELGYEPDYLAQSLRRGATLTIGFILRDIATPMFADIVKGAEQRLRDDGYWLLLMNSDGDSARDASHLRLLRQRRVDGMIVSLQSETHLETLEALRSLTVPVVLIDRTISDIDASAVLCDHRSGVAAAVGDLITRGHRHIAFISGPPDIRASRERFGGFVDAHARAGLAYDDDLVRHGSYATPYGEEHTADLLSRPSPPTAIVAGGVQLAIGAITALRHADARIGQEVSIVACDQSELMSVFSPPISAVQRDSALMGSIAAELLLERLGGGEPRTVEVPTTYARRKSVGPPARLAASLAEE